MVRSLATSEVEGIADRGGGLCDRFGDGVWRGNESEMTMEAPLAPLCVSFEARTWDSHAAEELNTTT